GQYVEGKARAYGIELSSRYQSRRWTLWVSYAGGRSLARSAELGEESFRPARYDVPRSLYVVGSRSIKKWRFTAAMDLRSGSATRSMARRNICIAHPSTTAVCPLTSGSIWPPYADSTSSAPTGICGCRCTT